MLAFGFGRSDVGISVCQIERHIGCQIEVLFSESTIVTTFAPSGVTDVGSGSGRYVVGAPFMFLVLIKCQIGRQIVFVPAVFDTLACTSAKFRYVSAGRLSRSVRISLIRVSI